jgi:hypothetical protein
MKKFVARLSGVVPPAAIAFGKVSKMTLSMKIRFVINA